jgi:hypothetical protein
VRVKALHAATGEQRWSRDFATRAAVNATQLAAHHEYIPILLAPVGDGRAARTDSGLPALQLVGKRDGELGGVFSIKDDYRRVSEATCDMYLLVTPTRMIVQVGGNLIAYGESALRSAP